MTCTTDAHAMSSPSPLIGGDGEPATISVPSVEDESQPAAATVHVETFEAREGETARLGLLDSTRPGSERSEFVSVPLESEHESTSDDGGANGTYRVDEALDSLGFGKFQKYMLFFVGLAWTADAMEMMLLSFIGPAMRCEFGVSADAEGALTSVVFVGMMLGAPTWGVLSDTKGRKPSLLFSTVTTLIAGIGSALGATFRWVLFFRFLVGFGLGGVPVAYGLFMEFLPNENRGVNLTLIEFFWTLGSMCEAALAWMVLPRHSWRLLLLLSTIPLFVLLVFIFLAPESALYSVSANRMAEAKATLQRVAEMNGKALPRGELVHHSSPDFDERTRYGESRTLAERVMPSGIRRLLSSRHRKTSLLVWVIFFGVAFLYYGVVLLTTSLNVRDDEDASGEIACLAHGAPKLSNSEYADIFLSSMGEIPGLIIAIFIIDRIGRRRSMGFTLVATAVCIFPLAFASISTAFRDFVLFCARSSAMAAFTVLYVFAGEVYPTTIRSTGVGVGNGFARIGGILCPVFAVTLIESGQVPLSVVFFLIVAVVSAAASFALRVETSGRRLDADDEPGIELSDVST